MSIGNFLAVAFGATFTVAGVLEIALQFTGRTERADDELLIAAALIGFGIALLVVGL